MKIDNVEHINYRGAINFCNYKCSYCPFGKKEYDKSVVEEDVEAFSNFYENISKINFKKGVTILLTPYGEGIIHTHYLKYISLLSRLDGVKGVSCQTNLSFDVETFIKGVKEHGGDFKKIYLWGSYHPTMAERTSFLEKVEKLSKVIKLSIGTVGIPRKKGEIINLSENLPKNVKFWINSYDKKEFTYKKDEIDFMKERDENFKNLTFKCDMSRCSGGVKSIVVDKFGNIYPCVKNKARIGKLPELEERKILERERVKCDCFLTLVTRDEVDYNYKMRYLRY